MCLVERGSLEARPDICVKFRWHAKLMTPQGSRLSVWEGTGKAGTRWSLQIWGGASFLGTSGEEGASHRCCLRDVCQDIWPPSSAGVSPAPPAMGILAGVAHRIGALSGLPRLGLTRFGPERHLCMGPLWVEECSNAKGRGTCVQATCFLPFWLTSLCQCLSNRAWPLDMADPLVGHASRRPVIN